MSDDRDTEPRPFIGFSGVLAVLSGLMTASVEAWLIFSTRPTFLLLLIFPVTISVLVWPYAFLAVSCIAALHFRQPRWAGLGAIAAIAGAVVPIVWLTIASLAS